MYRNIIQNIKNQSCAGATSGASAVLVCGAGASAVLAGASAGTGA